MIRGGATLDGAESIATLHIPFAKLSLAESFCLKLRSVPKPSADQCNPLPEALCRVDVSDAWCRLVGVTLPHATQPRSQTIQVAW